MIDMQKFCVSDTIKYNISTPWVSNGKRYATNDGRICICIPAPGEPDSVPKNKYPEMDNIFVQPNGDLVPWPTTQMVRGMGNCPACNGTGKINRVDCETCDGCGTVECPECGSEMVCRKCTGKGSTGDPCTACKDGKAEIDLYRVVGNRHVSANWDALIITLPNVRYVNAGEPREKLNFVFDGGYGVVMPIWM